MALAFEQAVGRLKVAFDHDRLGHAYLVSGGEGGERFDLAATLAGHVNGTGLLEAMRHPDVHCVEPHSKSRRITIEQIRNLEGALSLKRGAGRRKVAVLVDAERMTQQASNAFLKTLEEPPGESLILLLSGLSAALLPTIRSRCIPVELRETATGEWGEMEMRVWDLMMEWRSLSDGAGLAGAMRLGRRFQSLLAEEKGAVEARHETEWKEEEAHYRQTTEGNWLEDREDWHAAAAQAEYLQRRGRMIEYVGGWWSTILRERYGCAVEVPERYRRRVVELAGEMETPDLLRRIEALEKLRGYLERNLQEAMVLETGFLEAFG